MDDTPGGKLGGRPLHFILLCDCSSSMSGLKIQSLNQAITNALEAMKQEAKSRPSNPVLVRVIVFSSGAQWHVSQATPIENLKWTDMHASGSTAMGQALRLLAEQMDSSKMPDRGLPPVLVLVSDGQPTDDFNAGLADLMAKQWGKRAIRISIGIGNDADMGVLQKFMGNTELSPFVAHNADQLTTLIHWASTVVVNSAIKPPSGVANSHNGAASTQQYIPPPSTPGGPDIW